MNLQPSGPGSRQPCSFCSEFHSTGAAHGIDAAQPHPLSAAAVDPLKIAINVDRPGLDAARRTLAPAWSLNAMA